MMKRVALCVALATAVASPSASANGRFPFAQHVIVGPGAASTQVVLRATFGMLWSRDSGRTFRWACEQSMGFTGNWDAPMVFGTGALVVGLPDGLVHSPDGCDFARAESVPNTSMIDLAAARDGATIYGVEDIPVVENRVFASTECAERLNRWPGRSNRRTWPAVSSSAPARACS